MDETLISLIEDAFSGTDRRAIGPVSVETCDDEGTHAHFAGTKWRDHDVTELRAHVSALSFFTPKAFRCYLPAFLVASIAEPGKADVIPEHVIVGLERACQRREERWQAFSTEERRVIAKWIEWYRDRIYPHDERRTKQRRERDELSALAVKWWVG